MKHFILFAASALATLAVCAEAQVYELTITLKSTATVAGAITPIVCDTPIQEVKLYRKQSTVKIKGLFWGCDCETIAEPQFVTSAGATYGYILWNETTHQVLDAAFAWHVLNRIDKKLKKAEGAWTIGDTDAEVFLSGSGFGTVKDAVSKSACTIDSVILSPMSGNCAGWLSLPAITVKGSSEDCTKCGEVTEGTDDIVSIAPGWSLCACGEGSEFTAASGTWKLKYHAAASKKWQKAETELSITKAYSFPSYVKTFIESL